MASGAEYKRCPGRLECVAITLIVIQVITITYLQVNGKTIISCDHAESWTGTDLMLETLR